MVEDFQIFEMGHWRPTFGTSPEAEMILFRYKPIAPAGMTFVNEPPLDERIRQWLHSESIDIGAGGKSENVLGEVEYLRFTRGDATECVFMRQYGDTFSDQRDYFPSGSMGHGNIMIRGYYCVAPFQELSQKTLERFLSGIGIKGFGVPEKPQDLALPGLPAAVVASAGILRKSARSEAFPYAVTFTSMVYKTSAGQELADELNEVSLDHGRMYVYLQWEGLTKERHIVELRVYDGAGKNVGASDYEFTPTSTRWNIWLPYDIDPDVDQSGRWRFEADLDGELLVEMPLIVTPSEYSVVRSGSNEVSRDTAFHDYRMIDEASNYKIFIQNLDGAWAWRVRETFYAAQDEAMGACHKRAWENKQPGVCRVYAAGDTVVWDMSPKEREIVIKAYAE
jgi:hypothetical protein